MRQRYTEMIAKYTMKTLWVNLFLTSLLLGASGFGASLSAQTNCVVEIEEVNVTCNYSNGQSTFTASVEISWSGGTTGAVVVSLGGQTQTVQLPGTAGSITLQD
ncbi:MAG TPA: hypothetical protein VJ933_08410, partial [Phaeodactylibacter sp.]|nr:hypothetical protein [Phaeodactylibacter sp.]